MKTKSAILSAATLLAAIVLNPASATAESVATGCLAKLTGEIYSLNAYKSGPAKKCRSGDQIIRQQLHQPDTKFAKRSKSFASGQSGSMFPIVKYEFEIIGGYTRSPGLPEGNCTLAIDDIYNDWTYVVMSVPPGQVQDRITKMVTIDWDAQDYDIRTTPSSHVVDGLHFGDAFYFHEVLVDNRGGSCFVAFVVENAGSKEVFYAK